MKSSVQISRGVESLFGTRDENIRLIESGLKVNTQLIDNLLEIEGEAEAVSRAEKILEDYVALVREGHVFNNGDLNSYLRVVTEDPEVNFRALVQSGRQRNFGKKMLAPKTVNRRRSHARQSAAAGRAQRCAARRAADRRRCGSGARRCPGRARL